jgi:hypothetical protein
LVATDRFGAGFFADDLLEAFAASATASAVATDQPIRHFMLRLTGHLRSNWIAKLNFPPADRQEGEIMEIAFYGNRSAK